MVRFKPINKLIIFLFAVFFVPQFIFSADISDTSEVTISAQVISGEGGEGGGGGGSSGSNIKIEKISISTVVNFSGIAYPEAKVFILQDGQIVASTLANQEAYFSVSLTNLSTDTYTFSVYGEDLRGRKSSFFSFPIFITSGTIVNIGNIFLSPTIEIDKSEVKKGDNLRIFGQSVPEKEITISIHSGQEYFYQVMSDVTGAYLYNLNTSLLDLGKHQTKSKTTSDNQVSLYTTPLVFLVGIANKFKDETICSFLRGDLNCDNHVNLIDFSIMAYWYKKINPPEKVDLNGDGKITLVDFSIMAFNWTG